MLRNTGTQAAAAGDDQRDVQPPPYYSARAVSLNPLVISLLTDLEKITQTLPPCAEKVLKQLDRLLQLMDLRVTSVIFGGATVVLDPSYIQAYYLDRLVSFAQDLGLSSELVNQKLAEIRGSIALRNYPEARKSCQVLSKIFQPFNIPDCLDLIAEAKQSGDKIAGQDVMLLLGRTGAGKSTLIHWLCGSKLEPQQIDGLSHIGPVAVRRPSLDKIKTSPHMQSETRYISAVGLKYQDLGIEKEGGIFLCDTPGFGDTGGAEIDIANGLGVLESLQGARSVRVVMLFSREGMGSRGEFLLETAYLLVKLVKEIGRHIETFSFVFTKYSQDQLAEVNAQLRDKKSHLSDLDKADKGLMRLFEAMLEETEDAALSFDPLSEVGAAKKFLKKLLAKESIKKPGEVFHFSASETSRQVLREQLVLDEKAIRKALLTREFGVIHYRLDQLLRLVKALNWDHVTQAYQSCLRLVVSDINHRYEEARKLLLPLSEGRLLSEKSLTDCQVMIRDLHMMASMREGHFKDELASEEAFLQFIKFEVDQSLNRLKQHPVSEEICFIEAANVKLISENLQSFRDIFDDISMALLQRVAQLVAPLAEYLEAGDYQACVDCLSQFFSCAKWAAEYLAIEDLRTEYQQSSNIVLEHFAKVADLDNLFSDTHQLQEAEVVKIEKTLRCFSDALKIPALFQHVEKQQIEQLRTNILSMLKHYFEGLQANIRQEFDSKREQAFEVLEERLAFLSRFHQISGVESVTAAPYHSIIQSLCGFVKELRRDAEQSFQDFMSDKEDVDFQRLSRGVISLRKASWLEKYEPGVISEVLLEVNDNISRHVEAQLTNFQDCSLEINQVERIHAGIKLLKRLELMSPLDKGIPQLVNLRDSFRTWLIAQFDSQLMKIRTSYNVDRRALKELQDLITEYKRSHEIGEQKKQKSIDEFLASHSWKAAGDIEVALDKKSNRVDKLSETLLQEQALCDDTECEVNNLNAILKKYQADSQAVNERYAQDKDTKAVVKAQMKLEAALKEQGFDDEEILKAAVSKKEELLQTQEFKVQEIRDGITRFSQQCQELTAIKSQLEDLIKQQDCEIATSDAIILAAKGYNSIDQLSRECEALHQRLSQQIDVSALPELFEEDIVDLDFAEQVFNYFEICAPLNFINQLPAFKSTEAIFIRYMKQFCRQTEEEIRGSFADIKTAVTTSSEESVLLKSAQLLLSRYKRVKEIGEHYPKVFKCFTPALLEDFSSQLQAYFLELSDEMVKLSTGQATSELKVRLAVARTLGSFDFLMNPGSSFMGLYTKYRDVFYQGAQVTSQVLAAIKNLDYPEIGEKLENLTQLNDHTTRRAVTQIQDALSRVLKDLVEATKTEVIMLPRTIDDRANQVVRTVKTNLDKLREARTLLDPYLQQSIKTEIEQSIEEIKKGLSQKIVKFLGALEASLDMRNFYEADIGVDFVTQAKALLGRYCTEEISERLESLGSRIEGCLEQVVDDFSKIPIEKYNTNPPRELFSKFESATKLNQKYNKARAKLQAFIETKCREALDEARKLAKPELKNEYVRKVKLALRFLPDDLKDALQHELEAAKQDIDSLIEETKGVVTDLIDSDNLAGMSRYIDDRKHSPTNAVAIKYLEEKVIASVKELHAEICRCMDSSDYLLMMPQLKKLFEYQYYFSGNISQVSHYYAMVQSRLASILDDCWKTVECSFSLDSEEAGQYTVESNNSVEINFNNLANFVDLYSWLKTKFTGNAGTETAEQIKLRDAFPVDFIEKQLGIHKIIANYFQKVCDDLQGTLSDLNVLSLTGVLEKLKRWERFLASVKRYTDANRPLGELKIDEFSPVFKYVHYNTVCKNVLATVQGIQDKIIRVEFLQAETQLTNKSREEFYQDLDKSYHFIKDLKHLQNHYNAKDLNVTDIQKAMTETIRRKLDVLVKESSGILGAESMSKDTYKRLNLIYQNLYVMKAFLLSLQSLNIDVKSMLDALHTQIIQKVEKFEAAARTALSASELQQVAKSIIQIKSMGENILLLKPQIDGRIDAFLNSFKKLPNGSQLIAKLGVILNSDPEGVGQIILSEHKCFVGYAISLFNEKTLRHGLPYVLENIGGAGISKPKLETAYNDFNRSYKKLVQDNLKRDADFGRLKTSMLNELSSIRIKLRDGFIVWPASLVNKVPEILAHLFAIWTLKNATHYFDAEGVSDRDNYLMQPHVAQVISILRVLGVDGREDSLQNHLVQIGTGEGKSVTLAITASLFALLDFEVSCVCYSSYLSERDHQAFSSLFDELGVTERIHYGTFNKLCESVINERGAVRELVLENLDTKVATKKSIRPSNKILLIDEVDVFFSKDFYGSVYTPSARLQDPTIINLADFIWANRSALSLRKVKESQAYKDCCIRYKGWENLLEEAVKDMISDAGSYLIGHEYDVKDDCIRYKDQDTFVTNMVVGYKTLFAYYHEHQQGRITEASLRKNTAISIQCGNFSYAEVPLLYNAILGVTGTLKTLSEKQQTIIMDTYGIRKVTYAPSVFGQNNLKFNEVSDIFIETAVDYPVALKREIDNRLQGRDPKVKRAVLVFFEDLQKLRDFYHSPAFATLKDQARIMTEELDSAEKSMYVKQATNSGQVTLLTRSFGRGVDFICRDQIVYANGGVHVIQTFVSTELSEEVQIKGRTARQGDEGSYSMVLNGGALEYFQITPPELDLAKANQRVYVLLNQKRNNFFDKQYAEDTKFVEQNKLEHQQAMGFVQALLDRNVESIRQFLGERNQGTLAVQSRTLCLMDATGSMAHLLQKAKTTVGEMFSRAKDVLQTNGLPETAFEIQFAVYRNYSCNADSLLQASPWETKPANLRAFLDRVSPEGGLGNEAIEIGLWHANEEHSTQEVDQVILIGDAAANTPAEIAKHRSSYHTGKAYWAKTKFNRPTTADEEINRLVAARVPVHAFYVVEHAGVVGFFKSVAQRTGGREAFLDVNSASGADMLTNMVTEEVLRSVGNNHSGAAGADKLVQAYRSRFAKSYTS